MITNFAGNCCVLSAKANQHDGNEILAGLKSDLSDVEPMYQKLFASGHGTADPTMFRVPITICPVPVSRHELLDHLERSLGEDPEGDASDE